MEIPATLAAHPLGAALLGAQPWMAQAAQTGLRTSVLLSGPDKTAALQVLREISAFAAAATHQLVAEAIDQGVPAEFAGEATTPAQWLRSILKTTTHEGRALAETAQLLDRHPETIAMLAAGEGSLEHAKVMAKGLEEIAKLPGVTREEHARAAATLRADVATLNPVELGRVGAALVEALTRTPSVDDPDDEPDLADPLPDRWLRIDKHRDGTSDGRWRNLDPVSTAALERILADGNPKTSKTGSSTTASYGTAGNAAGGASGSGHAFGHAARGDCPGAAFGVNAAEEASGLGSGDSRAARAAFAGTATGTEGGTDADGLGREDVDEATADRRTRGQRWLDGLAGLLRHASDCDPDSPPAQSAITLTVATAYDVLAKQLGEGLLDDHTRLHPGEVRALACAAGILPAVMDGPSKILDLGRTQRLFTTAQRSALTVRDRGCTFPGCDQPAHRAIAHHQNHWEHGGGTDLDNAALLCLHHHIRIHREKWQSRLSPVNGHVEWRPPAAIDPERRWRQHIRYRIDRLRR